MNIKLIIIFLVIIFIILLIKNSSDKCKSKKFKFFKREHFNNVRPTNKIYKMYFINLDRHPDRRKYMLEQFDREKCLSIDIELLIKS